MLALETLASTTQVGTIAFAILAVPPGLFELKEVFRNLGPWRQKRAEVRPDLSHFVKRIIKLPSMNVHQFSDKLPCPLVCGLGLQRSGASKIRSRLILGEAKLEKLFLVELKRAQMCTPTKRNTVSSQK